MSSSESGEEAGLEVGEGSAGEAQERGGEQFEGLAERPPLSEQALDERQEKFRTTRRHGGPDLHTETEAREEAQEDVPDIEPTETEEEDRRVTGGEV
jgi:hypothetical protein